MLDHDQITSISRHLNEVLNEKGGLVYSAFATIRAGDVYVMGLNPGGDPAANGMTIGKSLNDLPDQEGNDYLDKWNNHAPGQAPLQKRMAYILNDVLEVGLEQTFATNLIFRNTRSARDLNLGKEGALYWPVHQTFMRIVQPRLILAFGNSSVSPYAYIHNRCRDDRSITKAEESQPAGHGKWRIKRFRAEFDGRATSVVGLPHLSRYDPTGKPEVVEWLRDALCPREQT
jgi:hypothetical protein